MEKLKIQEEKLSLEAQKNKDILETNKVLVEDKKN